ncbi:OmpA family protein [Xanthocytophaga flava]|nr:OmpA family protein [Xanthocytophaga flavus]
MKKVSMSFLFFIFIHYVSYSQLLDRMLKKVEDKVVDKTEEAINKSTQKKDKKTTEKSDPESKQAPTDSSETQEKESGSEHSSTNGNTLEITPLKAYSKFDFVPGDKVITFEDFSRVGADDDLPEGWNTNGSSEIVTLNNYPGKWMALKGGSYSAFLPEFITNIPENATIEFDMILTESDGGIFFQIFNEELKRRQIEWTDYRKDGISIDLYGDWIQMESYIPNQPTFQSNTDHSIKSIFEENVKKNIKVSIWRQKERLRMYLNDRKVMDIARTFNGSNAYNTIQFVKRTENDVYIRNIRVAVGNPDIRAKLAAGKFSTNGILFDVNEDKIKPESYGVLKQIAEALKSDPSLKVKIIGHTDSDGDASRNTELSKRRATSVKTALSKEFGIEDARMTTDGKGATEPVNPNTTAEGKANNRRVEFIKTN